MGSEDKSGRSNHSEPHSGITDWNGGHGHADSHPRDINGSWHNEHLDIISELIGGSGTSYDSETRHQVIDNSGSIDHFVMEGNISINPFETIPEVGGGNERGKHRVMHPFITFSESDLVSNKSLRSLSSSSSSSASLPEDLFQLGTGFGDFGSHTQPSKDEEINVSNNNSSKSKAFDNYPGPTSTSHFSQFTNEPMVHDMPPTQSPPRQVMDRLGEYDPLRIPSAIFERSKSSSPLDWSAASNDSLFSIHIGNNSFSREHFKSGELTKTEEFIMFNPSPTIPEVGADRESAEFDIPEVGSDREGADFEIPDVGADREGAEYEKSDATRGLVKNTKNAPKETTVDKSHEKAPPANILQNPSDTSNHSSESSRSFAFPIKKKKMKRCCACGCIPFFCCRKKCKRKKCAWPSCYCSNCSCAFCYCSWPSCYFRWPSCYCSNCSWAFCYCWNCSLKRWCCHSSTTLTDRVKSVTVKPDVQEKQQKKPLATEETPKSSSSCCCFSFFSCPPCSGPPCSCSCPYFRCCGCCC